MLGKVAKMQTEPTTEPTGSPVPAAIPYRPRPRHPRSTVLAKLLSALRGDKYMVGAYPPDWHDRASAPDPDKTEGR